MDELAVDLLEGGLRGRSQEEGWEKGEESRGGVGEGGGVKERGGCGVTGEKQ